MLAHRVINAKQSVNINHVQKGKRCNLGRYVLVLFLPLTLSLYLARAEEERQPSTVVKGARSIKAERVADITKNLTQLPKIQPWKEGDPIKETNPRRHYGREERVRKIPRAPARMDSLIGFQVRAAAFLAPEAFDGPILNIDGQGFTGVNPPDSSGDVGIDVYIQAINTVRGTAYTIYNKATGAIVAGPFRLSDLGGSGVTGMGDPIVLYDHLANRWVLTEFAEPPTNAVHVYISKTSDPVMGGFHHYQFNTPNFPDYPKYGVWHDAYYLTSNESDGPAVYALDRAKMLNGDHTATVQRFLASQLSGFGFQALTPCDVAGPAAPTGSPSYMMRHRDDEVHNVGANDPNQDFLDLYEVHVDWTNPANSTFTGPIAIPVAEFDSNLNGLTATSCFPQKGSTIRLDPLREVIMARLQYRNFGSHEAMVGSFVTNVNGIDHGGVRWFELRKIPGATWQIHQEGTYAPDSHNRWMSSIAMDGKGNIALAYNVSSATMFPSLRYVGRLASDPMGTLPRGEHTLIEGTAANASNRYGDYASLSVDPANDEIFWFTGEYNQSGTWTTRISAFRFKTETAPPTMRMKSLESRPDIERRLRELEEKVDRILSKQRNPTP